MKTLVRNILLAFTLMYRGSVLLMLSIIAGEISNSTKMIAGIFLTLHKVLGGPTT